MVPEASGHPFPGGESFPLSPLQEGFLFHHLAGAACGTDVEQCVAEFAEPLEPDLFFSAWRAAVARHEVLRTSFVPVAAGGYRQVVQPEGAVSLRCRAEACGSEAGARAALAAYLEADRLEGFPDLRAPLLRLALFRAGDRSWWVASFHHLLLDARALGVLVEEVLRLHDAWRSGSSALLRPAPRYRAYLEWLGTQDPSAADAFWREELAGLAGPTRLPLPRPAPEPLGSTAGELGARMGPAVTARLRTRAAAEGVTLHTLLQAAWALLLARYTGTADVVFGAVRACRHVPIPDPDRTVGLFVNTVPFRVSVPAAGPAGPWLAGIRARWVALRAVEHGPLARAQRAAGRPAGEPLFETLVSFQDPAWDAGLRGPGRTFSLHGQPTYPLALDAEAGAGLRLRAVFDPARFGPRAVARLLGHLQQVLGHLAAGAADVAELSLLPPGEVRGLRRWSHGPVRALPRGWTIPALIARQAELGPRRTAVAGPAGSLTYADLELRARRVAERLRAGGIGPGEPVAVCLDGCPERVVAWLGILQAGALYVPLDPGYPPERLAFQWRDCGARVLLTRGALRAALPAGPGEIRCVDDPDWSLPGRSPSSPGPSPDDLAYLIYTSGSTGRPKGVPIDHRGLLHLAEWHRHAFHVTPADRASHLASPAFDAAVWEVWPYLAAGAGVHLPGEETRLDPARLWAWFAAQRITVAFLPTPLAEASLAGPWPEGLALRLLLTGGDVLRRRPPANFPCPLVNNYGPTENVVVSTSGPVAPEPALGRPTIGRPIANTEAYVLDEAGRLAPVGVPGELWVGGPGLSPGYWRRPDLTAPAFAPAPRSVRAGQRRRQRAAGRSFDPRLYRTGDHVRWTEEGEIEFLGRADGQLKVRGCRIEPAEIEAALQAHPDVREGLVVGRPDPAGVLTLAAYVLPVPPASPSTAELRTFLAARLPAPMVPSAFVVLSAWPLTPNGKVDRAALPEPDRPAAGPAASGPTEERVARIWSELLGRPAVGRDDNFFELGGHSLLAAQVVSRLSAGGPPDLSVRLLFDHPTVAELAVELDRRAGPDRLAPPSLPPLRRRSARPEALTSS